MLPLFAVIALLAGPVLLELGYLQQNARRLINALSIVAVGVLLLVSLLPEAVAAGGHIAWLFVAVGLALPIWIERHFQRSVARAHFVLATLGAIGLLLHCLVDGLILLDAEHAAHESAEHSAALGVIIHELPKGIVLWMLLVPAVGRVWSAAVLVAMSTATLLGGFSGGPLLELLTGTGAAWFQAFVVGSIAHVAWHSVRPETERS
jgi:hypothetical protein